MTDLHYLSYDPAQVWEKMMDAYHKEGGGPLFYGDEKEIVLRAAHVALLSAFAAHDYAARMRTLSAAEGAYLDAIGNTRGAERIKATKAKAELDVVLRGMGTVVLQKGTVFTYDGLVFYATLRDVMAGTNGEDVTVRVSVECTENGEVGNRLLVNQTLQPVKGSKAIVSAIAITSATGGREAEEDAPYRERIRSAESVASTTGTRNAYRMRAMAVSVDILDARALCPEPGIVDIWLRLKENATEPEKAVLITKVIAALNADDARPLTDRVNVKPAERVEYLLAVKYTLPQEDAGGTYLKMEAAANVYREWQEKTLGISFDPYRLQALLYEAGAERAEISAESYVGAGAAVYTQMNPNQYLSGNVKLMET